MSLTDQPTADSCCAEPVDAIAATARRGRIVRRLALRHAGETDVAIAYECIGPADAPVIVVAGGISADRHLAAHADDDTPGWWDAQVGIGRALDPTRTRLLAIDWLGCDGALDVALDTADQADAIAAVLDHLGIARLQAFVGASYGAMVGLQFAARHGDRLATLVAISGAHKPHPFASAWRALQRQVVRAGGGTVQAVALARQWAMLSYRTPEEFGERFPQPATLVDGRACVAAEPYLEACGGRFAVRVGATAFLRLSESIDLHAVDPAAVRVPTTVVAVSEDRLVPSADLHALAAGLSATGRLHHLRSRYGHDAFLTEHVAIAATLRDALAGVAA
jgi:homoserine O-acetyltransferase/O-succinyltransferase